MMQKFKEKNVNVTIHPTHPSKESLSRQPLLQFYKYFLKWYSTVCVLSQIFSLTIILTELLLEYLMRTIIYLTAFLITFICIQSVKQKLSVIQIEGFNRMTWGNSMGCHGKPEKLGWQTLRRRHWESQPEALMWEPPPCSRGSVRGSTKYLRWQPPSR